MRNAAFYETPEQQSILKTKLVAKYFGAWSKIMLAQSSGPIAFIDLFAGPGKFADGRASTPLWILNHAFRDDKLCARLITVFNDKEPKYVAQLRAEIDALPSVEKLTYKPRVSNEVVGNELVAILGDKSLVPTLFFIDPWGYKGLSVDLIGHAIKSWGCDCIFFFNYNRINLGITNPFVIERMNDIFGAVRAEQLRERVRGLSPDERRNTIINELAAALREVGGRFVLPFEFRSPHGERTSHYIVFVSKHFLGYHIMKEVMAPLSSDDGEVRGFAYIPVTSPQLRLLFDLAQPHSISALKELLAQKCAGNILTVWEVYENHSVDTPYTLRNFKDAIRLLEAEGRVTIDPPAAKRRKQKGEVTLANTKFVTFPV